MLSAMPRPPLSFRLKSQDAKELDVLLHGGVQQVRVVLRAMALLRLDQGASAAEVARLVPLTEQAIRKVAHRYRRGGLASALYERSRPGAAEVLAPAEKTSCFAVALWRGLSPAVGWTSSPVIARAISPLWPVDPTDVLSRIFVALSP